ncbi:PAS domain-containing protein [Streptacidiphilus monticola]
MPTRWEGGEGGTAEAVVDAHGYVVGWNTGAERLLGRPAADVLGRPAADLLAEPVSRDRLVRVLARSTERWSGPLALRHRDGHRVDVTVIAHHHVPSLPPGQASERTPESWRIVSALSGREPRPEDDDLAKWAFEELPGCSISLYDAQLRYRRSNRAMVPVVGLPDSALRGLGIHDITTQPQTSALSDGLRQALESRAPVHLESYQRTGGDRRIHAWSVDFAPLTGPDGDVHGVVLVAHDTTEQFWARKRLVLLNEAARRIGSTLDLPGPQANCSR